MGSPETTPRDDAAQWAIQVYDPRIIVVVVDATKELQLAPLKYALELSQPGDKLYLLGVLHQVINPMGYKQRADINQFNGTNKIVLELELRKKKAEFDKCMSNPELQKLFALKQVNPIVQIAVGDDRKVVAARQAKELRAKWVILDKHLKNDKSYLLDQLNCNLVLMKPKNQAVVIKMGQFNENLNSPDDFQLALDDKSIDLGTSQIDELSPRTELLDSVEKVVSGSFSQISISSAPPPSISSGSSIQNLQDIQIPTPNTEERGHFEGQSARTTLSGRTSFSSQGEFLDADGSSVQFSDHDASSPAQVTSSKGFRGSDDMRGDDLRHEMRGDDMPDKTSADDMVAESDRDRQSESGPAISSELEKVYPDSEDETPNPAVKVGSVGNSSSDAFYKIPGRPSMSTGDLQSLVPKSSSGATLYRPAPRSASDRGGDELMNILNPTPNTPPSVGTPRSVRTLQRSLKEGDLDLESPNLSNSPIGGPVNKFGSQNDPENRSLLENTAPGRRKTQRPFAPLCSHCKKTGPKFGSEAKKFTYAELEEATNNFDQENYIAEGGYGFVYRGRLEGGQEIAVKQYKAASSQGDDEFYSEVDVLKHAQHRNLVILVGYCIEDGRRLLVYEFVCNKSLDVHLSAKNVHVLEWKWRWKIAVGAARGLRYLHEECRVGCIVHRDMRPNNILLTHDFVPMVGDFGLARSQPSGDEAEETRVIGTLGYLAPEYAETGSITEKADVYSFGVVLLELITGRKAIDATRARGEMCLTEWARPVIRASRIEDIVDPRLKDAYDGEQVKKMVDAAGRCISKDPYQRPRMSEVLRLLERDAENDGSISRGNSVSELIGEIVTQNYQIQMNKISPASGRGIRREGSLDSFTSKASSKGSGASSIPLGQASQSPPITIGSASRKGTSKSERIQRSASLRVTNLKPSLNSPTTKSANRPKAKLSYGDML